MAPSDEHVGGSAGGRGICAPDGSAKQVSLRLTTRLRGRNSVSERITSNDASRQKRNRHGIGRQDQGALPRVARQGKAVQVGRRASGVRQVRAARVRDRCSRRHPRRRRRAPALRRPARPPGRVGGVRLVLPASAHPPVPRRQRPCSADARAGASRRRAYEKAVSEISDRFSSYGLDSHKNRICAIIAQNTYDLCAQEGEYAEGRNDKA